MWNYRIVKHVGRFDEYYQIHEAYYDKGDKAHSITRDATKPIGDTVTELKADLKAMLKAFDKPVLNYDDF